MDELAETPIKASIVVCVFYRGAEVVRCLGSLLATEGVGYEIVLVDDASTDDSFVRMKAFQEAHPEASIRIVRNQINKGVSGARNAGIEAARGEYVFFTDSDCVVYPDWLGNACSVFRSPRIFAVSGLVVEPPATTFAERVYRGAGTIRHSRLQGRKLIGCNMGFRREWLIGNTFDEALIYGCDEDEIAWRVERDGYEVGFAADAVVEHHHRVTLMGYLREAYQLGRGAVRFGYKKGSYLGRDLWLMTAALLLVPLAFCDSRFLLASVGFLMLQVGAILFNEVHFKGKGAFDAISGVPLCLIYYICKAWGAYLTLFRLALGGEKSIRLSKRAL